MKNKNILAMVLATSMLVPSNAYALSKSDFSDFPNDWSTPALTNAVENGLLVGANGKINASSFITRAEVSAIINRAFGAKKTSSLSSYRDVSSNAWYYNDMSKAVYMETFVGSDGLLNPEKNITREEAFSVIARAFLIDDGDYSELSKFNDGNNVSDWAKKSISGLIKKGYINGSNGNINPKSNITRAEFAQIMYAVAGSYISSPGEYSNNINGNLVVSSDNVVLKNSTIEGDLIITDGVDTGKIQLDSVSVKGRIVIRGGNIINITGKTSTGDIIVQNKNSDTEINVDKDSSVGNILYKTETKVTGEGKVGNITNLISNIEDEKTPTTNKPSGGSSSGGGGSSSSYTTYSVSNWQELKSAAKNAKSGDTIKLKDNITDAGSDTTVLDGVSSATLTISKKNITFDGNNKTITVAEGKTFCFDIDGLAGTTTGVAVKDLTIDGGSFSTKLGGAFFVEDGAEATFENVTFKNCKADSKSSVNGGGAIFINDHGQIPPKVTVKNCTFENNTVPSNDGSFTGRGGAIYANNFRATTPMVLTVTNSTFKNNCAAYGGAIAVDGIVDIKVTGCTFENNNSTVGGDDVYIYEGISSGKKNLSITSKVNATLSDNTYTNKSDSESNMNEMNVIFSRYYPSDFTGDMTTKAPEGAKDLTFKDIERTEVITADTEIPMNSISIEGKTYYYGVPVYVGGSLNTNFTVNGEKVTSEKIGDTNIYCYCSDKLTGDLYGTAEVPYADFYYGELNSVSEPSSNIVTKSDTAQSMRGEGLYDAVTSATTSKWGMYSNTFYEANSEADSTGGKILGVKTPIKLSADLYAKTIILKTVGVSCDNQLISIVDSIENLSSTPLNQFKTLYADGTLSAIDSSNSQVTTSSNVSATITDQTNYGNYQINVSDLPSEVNGRENIMGVIIETSDGAKYGLKHLENIWFRAGELAIASEEGISTHGNNISYERYKDIPGKTITKVTYILNGYKNLTIDNLNLYCGKLLGEEYSVTAENVQYSSNKEMPVKLTLNLPEGYEPKISLRKGRTDLTYDTDYTYNPENSTITIKNTENISPAVYTVIVSDNAENGYVSTKTTFTLNSSLSEKDIKFENNKLVITGDSGVTVDEYRNAITEIYVNDSSIRGAKGTSVINEDGSINFDAEASSHGSTTPIFPDGADGSYTLKLVATGYPTVTGTVGNGSVTPEPTEKLADGEWYGTGTWSLYYENKGPDIVRVIVENGVIKNAYSVKYTEDSGFERGQNILNNLTGLKNVDTIKEQLDNKEKGTAYDAVSGATMTAKGYLSAVENALERSMKFANDKKEQTVMWMDFSEFPKANMYFDENLDLTDVKLNVYISPNGEKKEIGFDQLADYGITTSIQNGTLITEDTPELSESNALQIDFIQEDSLISIPSKVVVSKKTNYTVPSHIVITFENGETQRLDIIEDEFNYEPKIIGSIKSMAIYDGDRKLTDGIYNEEYNDWEFSLKGIEPSESGQKWKFETYYIAVDSSEDTSNVKSFELDTNYLTTTYGVGYNLDLNDLNINIVTEKGSKQKLEGWQACLDRGFTAIPEDGYTFTEDDASASTKEIKISYGDLSKTFKVDVIDYEKQIPAKVKIYDGDSLVKTIDVNIEDWKDSNGMLTIYDIDMPEKYIDWSEDTFTLEVFNSSDDIISSEDYTISKYMSGKGMELHFSNYTEYDSYGGYLTFMFNYTGTTPPEPTNVTSEGSATVQDFGYDAKVSVTYNKDTGEIVSVADNGTDPGNVMNQSFWQSALAMFEKFVGKTAADIDSIDAVSGATLSSNAIKEAVKNALPSVSDTVDSPTVEAEDLRTQMLFAATEPAVLKISAPEETEVYYTTDGSNPTEDVGEKKKLIGQTISISPTENEDSYVVLKIAAQKNGVWSDVTEVTIEFVQIPENDTGTKVYVGKAVCAGAEGQPYDVKVKVTTVNGEIALLEDNGTEPIGDIDNAFWWGNSVMETEGMPSKLQGKNLKELLNARTTPSDNEEVKVDAISGATLSSDSVKYATIAALRSQPIEEGQGEITPPVIQSEKIVAPNSSAGSISVIMTGESGAEIRYTLDGSEPTEESSLISEIPPFYDEKGVVLEADTDTYPNGRIVVVKAAAFLDGKRSDTVIARYVFANPNQKHSYESGTFQGSYSDIQAEVEIESPNFDQKYYITNISLDYDSQQKYKSFLPELLSNVYLNQDTEGVATINGFETESQAVLAAIQNAIQKAFVAAQPVISIEPNKTQYVNDEEVTVTLSCPTNDTQIYYVVDKSDGITSGELSDFEENKILYNGSFTVKIENTDGGTVYIRAAAQTTDGKLSTIARKDLDFIKAVNENAFTVNGKNYGILADAVSALEQNGSGEIVLNDNIELLDSDKLPSVPCKIRSNEQQKYSIKGSILEANADITFDNVIYEINHIYANGHSVTIGEDVETSFSYWSYPSIYAGASYDAEETTIIGNPVITVNSGKFQLYGSGSGTTTVNGDVEIHIKGTAVAEVGGAYMNALVNGKVSVFVDDTATLEYFLGEQRGGSLTDIVLTIIGSPSLEGSTYRGSVNGTPKGTVDLSRATLTEEEIQKFEDFENIIKSETPENSEETSLIEDIKIDVSNEYELLDKTKESNIEESELEESEFISELSSNLKLQ